MGLRAHLHACRKNLFPQPSCSLVSILPELQKAEGMEGIIKYDEGSEIYFRVFLEKYM